MVTAGRGFTAERAQAAAAHGLETLSVSVDGAETLHNALRAWHGSHRAAMEAMDRTSAAGLKLRANTQLTTLALPGLEALAETLVGKGIGAWQVSMTVPMGRAADEPGLLLQPYEVLGLFPPLGSLGATTEKPRSQVLARQRFGLFRAFRGPFFARNARAGQRNVRCRPPRSWPRGRREREGLSVTANGELRGGNLRDAPLEAIWERASALRFTRDRTEAELWGYCATCYYAPECRAGCSWTSHVYLGRRGNNPFCHHRALELWKRGLRERLEPRESAPVCRLTTGFLRSFCEPVRVPTGTPWHRMSKLRHRASLQETRR